MGRSTRRKTKVKEHGSIDIIIPATINPLNQLSTFTNQNHRDQQSLYEDIIWYHLLGTHPLQPFIEEVENNPDTPDIEMIVCHRDFRMSMMVPRHKHREGIVNQPPAQGSQEDTVSKDITRSSVDTPKLGDQQRIISKEEIKAPCGTQKKPEFEPSKSEGIAWMLWRSCEEGMLQGHLNFMEVPLMSHPPSQSSIEDLQAVDSVDHDHTYASASAGQSSAEEPPPSVSFTFVPSNGSALESLPLQSMEVHEDLPNNPVVTSPELLTLSLDSIVCGSPSSAVISEDAQSWTSAAEELPSPSITSDEPTLAFREEEPPVVESAGQERSEILQIHLHLELDAGTQEESPFVSASASPLVTPISSCPTLLGQLGTVGQESQDLSTRSVESTGTFHQVEPTRGLASAAEETLDIPPIAVCVDTHRSPFASESLSVTLDSCDSTTSQASSDMDDPQLTLTQQQPSSPSLSTESEESTTETLCTVKPFELEFPVPDRPEILEVTHSEEVSPVNSAGYPALSDDPQRTSLQQQPSSPFLSPASSESTDEILCKVEPLELEAPVEERPEIPQVPHSQEIPPVPLDSQMYGSTSQTPDTHWTSIQQQPRSPSLSSASNESTETVGKEESLAWEDPAQEKVNQVQTFDRQNTSPVIKAPEYPPVTVNSTTLEVTTDDPQIPQVSPPPRLVEPVSTDTSLLLAALASFPTPKCGHPWTPEPPNPSPFKTVDTHPSMTSSSSGYHSTRSVTAENPPRDSNPDLKNIYEQDIIASAYYLEPHAPLVNLVLETMKLMVTKSGGNLCRCRIGYALDIPPNIPNDSHSVWFRIIRQVMNDILHEINYELGCRAASPSIRPTNSLYTHAMETFDTLTRSAKWMVGGARHWRFYNTPQDQIHSSYFLVEANYFPMRSCMSQGINGRSNAPTLSVWRFPRWERHTRGILNFICRDSEEVDLVYEHLKNFRPPS